MGKVHVSRNRVFSPPYYVACMAFFSHKILSRAFRNRFVELHFDDIPSKELEKILQQKCQLPSSYAKKMVAVMRDLQVCACIGGQISTFMR